MDTSSPSGFCLAVSRKTFSISFTLLASKGTTLIPIGRAILSISLTNGRAAGLAGLGDLVLTCFGALSRNRRVGFELGRGRKLDEIIAETRQVAEGVKTARSAHQLAARLGVEMPITEGVYQMLYEGKSPRELEIELMERPLKGE